MRLGSKLQTLATNPRGAVRAVGRQAAIGVVQMWARRQMRARNQLELFAARPADAFPPDFGDLWMLYRLIRRLRPRCVLEFGSGCSTIIVAQALWENAESGSAGRLFSVDAVEFWAEQTRRTLPAHVRSLCEVSFSPVIEVEYAGTPAFRHSHVPDVRPDFLYLDGPPLSRERDVAVDPLDLEPRFGPGFTMLVDGRFANVRFLSHHFARRYIVRTNHIYGNTTFTLVEQ
jgi:hypothetical protein